MKMLDMVRKHTAPETGNHRTMTEFVDRAKAMLHHSKQTQRIFVCMIRCRCSSLTKTE